MQTDSPRSSAVPFVSLERRPQQDQIFRQLLDAAPDAVVVVDPHGRIVFANSKTEQLFGYERDALLGETAEIRPWLQSFTLGAPRYTPYHVKEQIRAVEDLGLTSWILWNASGRYDPGSFRPEPRGGAEVGQSPRRARQDSLAARSR